MVPTPWCQVGSCAWRCQVDFQNVKAYWRGTLAALHLEEPRRREAAELLRQGLRMAHDGSQALPKLQPGCSTSNQRCPQRVEHMV